MKYLKNESLKTFKQGWKGNPFDKNEFQYVEDAFRPSFKKILKWQLSGNPQRKEKKADKWRLKVHSDISYLDSKKDFICWLGHACFLIQLNGVRMITDPVLYDLPMIKRHATIPFDISAIKNIDYILLSHDHRDHCDKKSLKKILQNNKPQILTALKMSDVIGGWVGSINIQEAGWYQEYDLAISDLTISFLPSRHWCRRGLTDFNRRLWGSFMIQTPTHNLYFGGDSGFGPHFAEIKTLFPKIDFCFLGIGAYKPRIIMKENHASPQEAMEAFIQLGAKKMTPMHYGTYDLSDEPIGEPYRKIQECFEKDKNEDSLLLMDVNKAVWI